jgi:hypothetical protein
MITAYFLPTEVVFSFTYITKSKNANRYTERHYATVMICTCIQLLFLSDSPLSTGDGSSGGYSEESEHDDSQKNCLTDHRYGVGGDSLKHRVDGWIVRYRRSEWPFAEWETKKKT